MVVFPTEERPIRPALSMFRRKVSHITDAGGAWKLE